MSSLLTMIVLGNAYSFLGNTSLSVPNQMAIANKLELVHPIEPVQREDYTYTSGIGAHKVHSIAAKWNEARLICRKEGGDLAVINSGAESKVLVQLMVAAGPAIGTSFPRWSFVGYHDLFKEGQWETVNGKSLLEAGFDQWVIGEPNGGEVENCGTIIREGKLNDGNCDVPLGFICELSDPAPGTSLSSSN